MTRLTTANCQGLHERLLSDPFIFVHPRRTGMRYERRESLSAAIMALAWRRPNGAPGSHCKSAEPVKVPTDERN